MSTLARQPDKVVGSSGETGVNGNGQGGQGMSQAARRASMGQQEPFNQDYQRQQPSIQQQQQIQQQQIQQQHQQQQQQSQLQAQRMYPNHPLLNSTSSPVPPIQWFPTPAPMTMNSFYSSPIDTYSNPILSAPPAGGFDIGRSGSMRMSPSEMGASSSSMGRMESGSSVGSYDYGYKKKACDQCNLSKVKCDFTYPCGQSLFYEISAVLICRAMCTSEHLLLIPQDDKVEVNRSHSRSGLRWYACCQWLLFWDSVQRHALWFWLVPIASIPLLDIAKYDCEPAPSPIVRCAPCSHERLRQSSQQHVAPSIDSREYPVHSRRHLGEYQQLHGTIFKLVVWSASTNFTWNVHAPCPCLVELDTTSRATQHGPYC